MWKVLGILGSLELCSKKWKKRKKSEQGSEVWKLLDSQSVLRHFKQFWKVISINKFIFSDQRTIYILLRHPFDSLIDIKSFYGTTKKRKHPANDASGIHLVDVACCQATDELFRTVSNYQSNFKITRIINHDFRYLKKKSEFQFQWVWNQNIR